MIQVPSGKCLCPWHGGGIRYVKFLPTQSIPCSHVLCGYPFPSDQHSLLSWESWGWHQPLWRSPHCAGPRSPSSSPSARWGEGWLGAAGPAKGKPSARGFQPWQYVPGLRNEPLQVTNTFTREPEPRGDETNTSCCRICSRSHTACSWERGENRGRQPWELSLDIILLSS